MGCDPIYCGYLENKSSRDLHVTVCGDNISEFGAGLDTLIGSMACKTFLVKKGEVLHLASASHISKPLVESDIKFDDIWIQGEGLKIAAEGKKSIMQLFKQRTVKNVLGIHSADEYVIEIVQ